MTAKAICNLCKEVVDIYMFDMYQIGQWVFHEGCYHIVLKRLKLLVGILFAPQDEFDEYLNEILRIMFRPQADATLGIAKE